MSTVLFATDHRHNVDVSFHPELGSAWVEVKLALLPGGAITTWGYGQTPHHRYEKEGHVRKQIVAGVYEVTAVGGVGEAVVPFRIERIVPTEDQATFVVYGSMEADRWPLDGSVAVVRVLTDVR